MGHLTQTTSDPRISSWNVGGGREEILLSFLEQDKPEDLLICPVRERRPHYLLARPEDPGEQSGCSEERAVRTLPPLLDLHFNCDNQWGSEPK